MMSSPKRNDTNELTKGKEDAQTETAYGCRGAGITRDCREVMYTLLY